MNRDFSEIAKLLMGNYRTVSLNVLYFLPEYSNILQEFHWQTDDVIPELVKIHKFLNHWHNTIEADIHEVKIACSAPLQATSFSHVKYTFPINWTATTIDINKII